MTTFIIWLIAFMLLALFLFKHFSKQKQPLETEKEKVAPAKEMHTEEKKLSMKDLKKLQAKSHHTAKPKAKKANPEHSWFVSALKGFGDVITGFDADLKRLLFVVASREKTVKIFKYEKKDLSEANPHYFLLQLDYFPATAVSLYNDILAVAIDGDNTIELYTFEEEPAKKVNGKPVHFSLRTRFEKGLHKNTIISLQLDKVNGKFIVTGSGEKDTTIKVWSMNGQNLALINTSSLQNFYYTMSPDQKYFYTGAWTPDVKVFEVKREKDGTFKQLARCFELKGHTGGVHYIGVDAEAEWAVTRSSDHSLRLWHIEKEFNHPKERETLFYKEQRCLAEAKAVESCAVAYSSRQEKGVVAVGFDNNIAVFRFPGLTLDQVISEAHAEETLVQGLTFHEIGERLFLFSTGTDDRVNVWRIPL